MRKEREGVVRVLGGGGGRGRLSGEKAYIASPRTVLLKQAASARTAWRNNLWNIIFKRFHFSYNTNTCLINLNFYYKKTNQFYVCNELIQYILFYNDAP